MHWVSKMKMKTMKMTRMKTRMKTTLLRRKRSCFDLAVLVDEQVNCSCCCWWCYSCVWSLLAALLLAHHLHLHRSCSHQALLTLVWLCACCIVIVGVVVLLELIDSNFAIQYSQMYSGLLSISLKFLFRYFTSTFAVLRGGTLRFESKETRDRQAVVCAITCLIFFISLSACSCWASIIWGMMIGWECEDRANKPSS